MIFGTWLWGVSGAVWGLIVSQSVGCSLNYFAIRREAHRCGIRIAYRGCLAEWPLFWSFGLPAFMTGLLPSVVAWGASALLANQAAGFGALGVYYAAMRVITIPEQIMGMFFAAILPVLSEAFGRQDRKTFERALSVAFVLATIIIIPISLIQIAAPALTMMLFGRGYYGHPEVVQWLMLHAVLSALVWPTGYMLLSMGRAWFDWLLNMLLAVSQGALAIWLVPRYGVAGLAASLALAFVGSKAVPMVTFLYLRRADVMSAIRWPATATLVAVLFSVCLAAERNLALPGAAAIGAVAGAVFLAHVIRPAWSRMGWQ
jgi:O-antigen/teichoic acid export membrane protein